MKFLKLLERNLPATVEEDSIIFTDKGNIYVNKKNGTLIPVGGAGGTSGGGGGGNTMETVDIVTELPEAAYDGDVKLYVKDGMPLWATFYGGYWYSYGMIKHKVKGFVTAEMIKEANPVTDGLVVSVVPDETISDFSSYVQVSHQIANGTRWIYFDFTCDEGILRIPWQVGTEGKYDFGYLTIDGTTILDKSGTGSGTHYMNITAGTHRVGLGFKGDVSNWLNGNFFRIWGIEYFVLPTPAEVLSNIPGGTGLDVVEEIPPNPGEGDYCILNNGVDAPKFLFNTNNTWYSQTFEKLTDTIDYVPNYRILIVTDVYKGTDVVNTVAALQGLGHTVEMMATASYIVGLSSAYDITMFTNFNISNINLIKQTYDSGYNVLVGYLLGTGDTTSGVDTLGIAEGAAGASSTTYLYKGPKTNTTITADMNLGSSILAMEAANFAMYITNTWVGSSIISKDLSGTNIFVHIVEAGEISTKGVLFPRRIAVMGTTHGRGGYTNANKVILDRVIRWIVQGNRLLPPGPVKSYRTYAETDMVYTNDYLTASPAEREGYYNLTSDTNTVTYLLELPANAKSIKVVKNIVTARFIMSAFDRIPNTTGQVCTKHSRNDGGTALYLDLDAADKYVAIYVTNASETPTFVADVEVSAV